MISHCAKKLRIGKMMQHKCRADCIRRNWPAWFKPAVFIPKSSLHINFTGWKMWSRRSCWWKTSRQTWLNHWFCCDACWKNMNGRRKLTPAIRVWLLWCGLFSRYILRMPCGLPLLRWTILHCRTHAVLNPIYGFQSDKTSKVRRDWL